MPPLICKAVLHMGQDSWNLQFGTRHPARTRKGTEVDMHPDDRANKIWKGKVLKANGNPKNFGPDKSAYGQKSPRENGEFQNTAPKRRK